MKDLPDSTVFEKETSMWLQLRCGFILLMAILWFVFEVIEPFKKTDQKKPRPITRLLNRPVKQDEPFHDDMLEKLISQGKFIDATEHLNNMLMIARELHDAKKEACYMTYVPHIEAAALAFHRTQRQVPTRDDSVEIEFMA
jgi:hypothetical protein